MKKIFYFTILSLLMFSCIMEAENNDLGGYVDEEEYEKEFLADNSDTIPKKIDVNPLAIDTSFIDFSNRLLSLLHDDKLTQFSFNFHPEKGCTFVPYTFLDDENLNFSAISFKNAIVENKTHHWGSFDGSGEPIDLNITDYFKRFVYDVNYKDNSTEIKLNDNLTFSNTLNNINEHFPNSECIEFYFDGSSEFDGMDWSSLIFYIENFNDTYYLVAVAHNQWTI